ncbi:hypothetical protein PPERSA_11739 [Pseudocohnilembus persalinus]|uniref:MORN motif n=1 Tax=Pseudocohnilembus persalinus TaxID=266149 RepID=A0A0V0QGK0_PSEPJ|nr:hypothetical protein PPERSA_11739 [Pseudocohnilembus persalinus]|eukprot:KRX01292.1 hypothetical protein PPERSA_11739 [Pseudocohnilembus persalinus]
MGNCNCRAEQHAENYEIQPNSDPNFNEQNKQESEKLVNVSSTKSQAQKNIMKNSSPSQMASYKQIQQIQKSQHSQQLNQSSYADLTKPVNLGFQLSGILDAHKCDKKISISISESIKRIKNQQKRQQIEEQLNLFLGYNKKEKQDSSSEKNIEIYENDINKQLEIDAIGNQQDNDKFLEHQILEFMDDNQKYEQKSKQHQPSSSFAKPFKGQVDKLLSEKCKNVLDRLPNFNLDSVPSDSVVSHLYYQINETQDVYIGMWKNGQMNGHGKTYFKDGSMFEGTFLNNLIHGIGRIVYSNGDYYSGQFQHGKYNGTGQLTYENGDEFKGNFCNGLLNGIGQYSKNKGKEQYKGEFKDNLKQGKGELIVQDIYKYTGDFSHDKINGHGECEWLNKKIYTGKWVNNQMHGEKENKKLLNNKIECISPLKPISSPLKKKFSSRRKTVSCRQSQPQNNGDHFDFKFEQKSVTFQSDLEKKINQYLDDLGLKMCDPAQKMHDFYDSVRFNLFNKKCTDENSQNLDEIKNILNEESSILNSNWISNSQLESASKSQIIQPQNQNQNQQQNIININSNNNNQSINLACANAQPQKLPEKKTIGLSLSLKKSTLYRKRSENLNDKISNFSGRDSTCSTNAFDSSPFLQEPQQQNYNQNQKNSQNNNFSYRETTNISRNIKQKYSTGILIEEKQRSKQKFDTIRSNKQHSSYNDTKIVVENNDFDEANSCCSLEEHSQNEKCENTIKVKNNSKNEFYQKNLDQNTNFEQLQNIEDLEEYENFTSYQMEENTNKIKTNNFNEEIENSSTFKNKQRSFKRVSQILYTTSNENKIENISDYEIHSFKQLTLNEKSESLEKKGLMQNLNSFSVNFEQQQQKQQQSPLKEKWEQEQEEDENINQYQNDKNDCNYNSDEECPSPLKRNKKRDQKQLFGPTENNINKVNKINLNNNKFSISLDKLV